ncbi:MBL fold hydrolase [Paenibacillus kribbensis]|uniref:MBL fold hydrolase n=1 Tax=Paenibacillus kribbensis TaxID=172713 RepID=A0A222WU24_9BACL|nr:MBL fold metallo-hydrolase [Paenibacillus kribbensis]ASR50037.1 MBL fold hydrolase [Paenibacillus kribbensis]
MTSQLQTKVFISSDQHDGFGVSSTIIYGPTEALLFDAQFSRSNALRLVAEILETGRELKQIFISHFHPDHYLGLGVIKEAFPNARVMAYKEVAEEANAAFSFKIDYWGTEVLGNNGSKTVVNIERIEEPHLTVDGEQIDILGLMRGDAEHEAILWIPSIKTLVAGDLVFSDAHVWVADARFPEDRQAWLDNLDTLEALKPEVIIPGHAPNDRPYNPNGIKFTRCYLKDFMHHLTESTDSANLIARMEQLYPDLVVHICLELSAKILKDKYRWEGDWPHSLRDTDAVI